MPNLSPGLILLILSETLLTNRLILSLRQSSRFLMPLEYFSEGFLVMEFLVLNLIWIKVIVEMNAIDRVSADNIHNNFKDIVTDFRESRVKPFIFSIGYIPEGCDAKHAEGRCQLVLIFITLRNGLNHACISIPRL